MKIFIGLLTPDPALRRHFGTGLRRVVHDTTISRGAFSGQTPTILLAAFSPQGYPTPTDCENFLLYQTGDVDACLLLVDRNWEFLVHNIRSAALCNFFDRGTVSSNLMNFFHQATGKLMRLFGAVHTIFTSGTEMQAMCLPRRNFHASEMREIVRLFWQDCHKSGFLENLYQQLQLLRRRRHPLRGNSTGKRFLVDDRKRFFEFGLERHARFPTGAPHLPSCAFNGYFRFGIRIDNMRHYNVTEEDGDRTSIEGEFDDCHDTRLPVPHTTHLNMFSNDYF